jgi:dienelactone hydrolase
LRDDSLTLAAMLERHQRTYQFHVYPGVLHAFLHNSRHLPEAMTALRDGAEFFRTTVAGDPAPGSTPEATPDANDSSTGIDSTSDIVPVESESTPPSPCHIPQLT